MKSVCLVGLLSASALWAAVPMASAQSPAYQPCDDADSVSAAGYDPTTRQDVATASSAGCSFISEQGNRMTLIYDNKSWEDETNTGGSTELHATPIDALSGHQAVQFDGPALPNSCIVVVKTADKPFEVRLDSYGDICGQTVSAASKFAPSLA
ncbi:DUF3558 family protein [Nocardia sp. alder85J]|uniref:DUF3558 family protein n=1 Tax=Nocardia sp. alder85J TaxID=2862949 RepID=UPI001CD6F8FA|nr:DUF3558 family protein [Nocardia sp. alder85J]MCX4095514.1 DUF3558 family protein [Nocardia sp. alder85J]